MEMNFFERHVVDAGFGFAELDEDFGGAVTNLGSELRLLHNLKNRTKRTMLGLIFCFDFDVGGGHTVFPDFFGRELPSRDLEASEFGAEVLHVAARVNQ